MCVLCTDNDQCECVCLLTCWSWSTRWWPQQGSPGPSVWCSPWRVWSLAGTAGSVSSCPERPPASGGDRGIRPSRCPCWRWQGYVSGCRSVKKKNTIQNLSANSELSLLNLPKLEASHPQGSQRDCKRKYNKGKNSLSLSSVFYIYIYIKNYN